MTTRTANTCLGCGKEVVSRKPGPKLAYPVCSDCADIMQQGLHSEHFKIIRAISRNMDSVRALSGKG
jgi:endogenous inhibitor of DNA gyrase (YacG/DUF329 family)